MDKGGKVLLDEKSFKEFKKKFKECPDGSTFVFQGHEFLKEYAKYVIQYIEQGMFPGPDVSKN